jgi:hypothetical protein
LVFDLRRSLRRIKPHRFIRPLRRRDKTELAFVSGAPAHGRVAGSCCRSHIDVLQGRTPIAVNSLLRLRTVNHLSECVAALTHAFGRLDPLNPATETVLKELARTVADIPPHRLATAATAAVIEAGILAGLLFRLRGLRAGQELAALNDATLYLHALSQGQIIVTRNLRDFDVLN